MSERAGARIPGRVVAQSPLRHDGVTVACPACGRLNVAWGRKQYCDDACRARAYRLRKGGPAVATVAVPVGRPRRPITVYECPACGMRAVGQQRCDCGSFMARVGLGGACPHCDAPVAVIDLLGVEVAAER